MKSIIALALLVVCITQVHSLYTPCQKSFFYTNEYPEGPVSVVDPVGHYPYPYAGHGGCGCSKCYPSLYTQLHRGYNAYY